MNDARIGVGADEAGGERLALAIARGRDVLWAGQRADGSWDERSDVGPASTANVLVALHHVGLLPASDLRRGAAWLRTQQRPDGSFVAYPFAPHGSLSVTAQCWAALHLDPDSADAARRAEAYVRAHGGMSLLVEAMRSGETAPIFLALAGLLPPDQLPCPSMVWALSDRVVRWLAERMHFGFIMGALQLSLIASRLRGDFGRDGTSRSPLERWECRRAVELLALFQNADGSWNSNTVQTAVAIPALVAAGVPTHDPRVARAARWLMSRRVEEPSGVWFDVFSSDLWTTVFNARALLLAGASPTDPRIVRAVEWTLDLQLTVPQPWPNNRRPNAVRTGGWPFQSGNETMADCDDAGVVLSLLGMVLEPGPSGERIPDALVRRIHVAVRDARRWLEGMQNPDGGWAAFVWSLPGRRPARTLYSVPLDLPPDAPLTALKALLDPPPELGDPSTEDLTARVLHGLGSHGRTTNDAEIAKSIEFLRNHQTDFGAWWGRWVCNYVASTAYVLSALARVREDLSEAYVQRAIRFLLARQNQDGGFGESIESYLDIEKAGRGPSTVPLTSLVVSALVEVGRGDDPAVARAVAYLVRKQRSDGTWPNEDYVATNIPPEGFYFYGGAVRHLPLEALARYARRHAQPAIVPIERYGRWSSSVLEPLRRRTDPVADDVVAAIYAGADLTAVNALLVSILRNDDPVPPGLPAVAQDYFERTAELPAWADPTKIAHAQHLFADFGVYFTFGLFCSSLPQAYCAANGAEVLLQTGALLSRVRQRVFETAQFLFDVLDQGALAPKGRGIRAAQRVRLMHAAVRHLVRHHPELAYDADTLGEPINQEDLVGTLMTFSVVTLDAAGRLGVSLSKADAEAWMHCWAVIGHLLGIEEELLPRDLADGEQCMEAIRQHQWAASKHSKELAGALIAMMQELFTREIGALAGLTPTLVRYLAGDRCADLLDLPQPDWTRLLVTALRETTDVIDADDRETALEHGLGALALRVMKLVTTIEREGKKAGFRLPASLRQTVTPGT
jgi:squalene cyclase